MAPPLITNAPLLSIPAGPPTSAILDRIERELRESWAQATKDAPRTRVVTMNLVVAASRSVMDRYAPVVDEVTAKLPSRSIMVTLEPDQPTRPLSGEATIVCTLGDAGTLCSERVRLSAAGSVCARVASAVEALLVPEIPTTLVWLGRVHVDDDVFASLAVAANRVVLDTEYTSLGSLLQLERWSREGDAASAPRPSFADLAWTRLAEWQELCARFFDEPATRALAGRIARVTVKQASEKGARLGSEGALLLGWLATRLDWRAARMGGALRVRRADGRDVSLQLGAVERPDGVAPAALASVVIEAVGDDGMMVGAIERQLASGAGVEGKTADADVVTWRLTVPKSPPTEQRIRLNVNKGARVLERTLHRPMRDPTLVESVRFAEHLFEDGVTVT